MSEILNTSTPSGKEAESISASSPPSNPLDLIQKANFAADRLEQANKEMARLLSIQQQLQIEKTLGGKTDSNVKTESEDEKSINSAKNFLKGSGLEDYAFPDNNQ